MSAKTCSLCGKRLPAESSARVYSRFTHSYYCVDVTACSKRARRRRRAEAAA